MIKVCPALRRSYREDQIPLATCQETGLSGPSMRERCPIQDYTDNACHYNKLPIGFKAHWIEIVQSRRKARAERLG